MPSIPPTTMKQPFVATIAGLAAATLVSAPAAAAAPPDCLDALELHHEEIRINNERPHLIDLDGDGRLDMITIDDPRVLRVYLDAGDGLVLTDSFQIMDHGGFAGAGDFDDDGHLDLLINATYGYSCGNNMVRVYWNTGDPDHPLTGDYTQIALMSVPYCIGSDPIDFDGDGLLDIITTSMPFSSNDTSRKTRTTRNLGDRQFAPQADFVWPRDLYARGTGDLDGDGHADFVATVKSGWADGQWGTHLRLGNGDGTFGDRLDYFQSERTTHGFAIDIDGPTSARSDFAVYVGTSYSDTLTLGRWSPKSDALQISTIPVPWPHRARHAADATFDGFEDIVLTAPDGLGHLAILENFGDGTFAVEPRPLVTAPGFEFLRLDTSEVAGGSIAAVAMDESHIRLYRAVCNESRPDCDGNGVSDADEIAAGAADLDGNGVPDSCECLADLTGNGIVNGADISVMLGFWGKVPEPIPGADINRDGQVNGGDLAILLGNWGACP